MADADQNFRIEVDAGSTPQQLKKITDLFNDAASGLDRFINITGKMADDGKKLEVTLEGVSKSFEKVVKQFEIGPRGGVQGLNQVTKASEELLSGFTVLLPIVDKFVKRLDSLESATKSVQQAITDSAQAQIQASQDADKADADAAKKRQVRAKDARRDLEKSVAINLGAVPGTASQSEITNFQNAQKRVAQEILDATRFPGGRGNALDTAFANAKAGAVAASGPTARLEQLVLALVAAYERLGNAADVAAQKAAAAAARQQAQQQKQQQQTQQQQQNQQQTQQRQVNADIAGTLLRNTFVAPTGASDVDAARIEVSIKRFQELILRGKVNLADLSAAVSNFSNTGSLDFNNLSASASALLRNLVSIDIQLTKQANTPKLSPLAGRQAFAQQTVADLQNVFASPISALGEPTVKVDKLINDLGLLVIKTDVSKQRLLDLFNAAARPGAALSVLPNLTKDEAQIVSLIRRIAELRDKVVNAAADEAAAQQLLNDKLRDANVIIPTIIGGFGRLNNANNFSAVQGAVNRLFDAIKKGQLDLQKLADASVRLGVVGAGGGKGGGFTPGGFLSPEDGGREQQALLAIGNLFRQTGDEGTKAAKSIHLNWQNVIRIFEVQVLHTVLGQFINDLRQSADAAVKFQIKISEIRTLSQENQLSTQQWAAGLRQLSDSFGLPILDVTKAAYDAISNQVTRGAQTFEFLRTTLNFALVTVSSATDAQNLLSSAVKSFGEQNLTAQKAAESLFKLIDLGRVTAGEISGIFGRVANLAGQAGLNIDELGAALATLTVQGVKPDEAFTLMNNLLLKLVKTTPEMSQLLLKLGFSSGEAALKTLGLAGVFRLLNKELESGGLERIGELEGNIRAIRAAVATSSGDPLAGFEKNLAAFSDQAKTFSEATKLIRESSGRELTVQLNEIRNIFSLDFGQNLIQSILNLSQPFGGLATIVKNTVEVTQTFLDSITKTIDPILKLSSALLGIAPGGTLTSIKLLVEGFVALYTAQAFARPILTAYSAAQVLLTSGYAGLVAATAADTAATAANTAAKGTNTAASRLRTAALGAEATGVAFLTGVTGITTLAIAAATFAWIKWQQSVNETEESIKRQTEALKRNREEFELNRIQKEQQAGVDDFNKRNEAAFKNAAGLIAAQTRETVKLLDNLHQINVTGVKGLEESLRSVFKEFDKKLTPFEQIKNILADIEKGEKRINSLQLEAQFKAFENSIANLDVTQQFDKITAQVQLFKNSIRDIIAKPTNAKFINAEDLDKIRKTFEDITKVVDKFGNSLDNAVKSQKKLVADLQVKGETKAFEDSLIGKDSAQQIKLTTDRVNQLRAQAFDLFKAGDLEEARRKFDEIDKLIGRLTEKQKQFSDKAGKLGFNFGNPDNTDALARRNEADRQGLEQNRLEQLLDLERKRDELQKKNFEDAIQREAQQKAAELQRINEAANAQQRLNELKKQENTLNQERKNLEAQNADAQKRRADAQSKIGSLTKDITERVNKNAENIGPVTAVSPQAAIEFNKLQQLSKNIELGNTGQTNLQAFADQLEKVHTSLTQLNIQQNRSSIFGVTNEEVAKQKQIDEFYNSQKLKIIQLIEAKKQQAQAEADIAAAQAGQRNVLDKLNKLPKAPAIPGQEIPTAIENFSTKLDGTLNNLITAINNLSQNIGGGQAPPRHRLGGPLGTDTHLFWGNPGEFVVNAASSERFAPQLRAINMGFEPKFNSNSSSNSINVGDIHVTVPGGPSNRTTARELGNEIKREIRRGNLR